MTVPQTICYFKHRPDEEETAGTTKKAYSNARKPSRNVVCLKATQNGYRSMIYLEGLNFLSTKLCSDVRSHR